MQSIMFLCLALKNVRTQNEETKPSWGAHPTKKTLACIHRLESRKDGALIVHRKRGRNKM